eukprot:15237193-Alexandrium_andersonii.AAC.1
MPDVAATSNTPGSPPWARPLSSSMSIISAACRSSRKNFDVLSGWSIVRSQAPRAAAPRTEKRPDPLL